MDLTENKRFYNIGAGSFSHPYWTNLDHGSEWYKNSQKNAFVEYDLMSLEPFPLESSTAEIIYSSHTIEHVNDEAIRNMFQESYRILKPGGCIRITAPDAWLIFQAYKNNDIGFFYWRNFPHRPKLHTIPLQQASIHQLFLHRFASQLCEIDTDFTVNKKFSDIEIRNFFADCFDVSSLDHFTKMCVFNPDRPGSHINWWTREKVVDFLKEAGFQYIYISGWGQSLFAPLRETTLFDSTHPKISLYVEAVK